MKREIRFQVGAEKAAYPGIPGASVHIKEMAQGGQLGAPHSTLNYRVPCPEAIIPLILVVLLMGTGQYKDHRQEGKQNNTVCLGWMD